jgi:hypothetical protein
MLTAFPFRSSCPPFIQRNYCSRVQYSYNKQSSEGTCLHVLTLSSVYFCIWSCYVLTSLCFRLTILELKFYIVSHLLTIYDAYNIWVEQETCLQSKSYQAPNVLLTLWFTIFFDPKVNCCVQKGQQKDPVLNQTNLIHSFQPCLFKINFNITLRRRLYSDYSFYFCLSIQIYVRISYLNQCKYLKLFLCEFNRK